MRKVHTNNSTVRIRTRCIIYDKHSDVNKIQFQASRVLFSINTVAHGPPNNNHSVSHLKATYPMTTIVPAILTNSTPISFPHNNYLILSINADVSSQPIPAHAWNTNIKYPHYNNHPQLHGTHFMKLFHLQIGPTYF